MATRAYAHLHPPEITRGVSKRDPEVGELGAHHVSYGRKAQLSESLATQCQLQSRASKNISKAYLLVQSIPARAQRGVTGRDRSCTSSCYPKNRTIYHTLLTIGPMVRRIEMQTLCLCLLCTRRDKPGSHSQQQQIKRTWTVLEYLSLFFEYFRWASQFHPGFPSFSIAGTQEHNQ